VKRSREAPTGTGWRGHVPGLVALGTYETGWLRYDLVAGIVLAAMAAIDAEGLAPERLTPR